MHAVQRSALSARNTLFFQSIRERRHFAAEARTPATQPEERTSAGGDESFVLTGQMGIQSVVGAALAKC
jgi:hypothetical protein